MSLQVEKLEKNMAKLTIEASAEDFEKAIQKVYLKARGRINIPGFRKGKAPRKLIEKMYGTGVFYEDAANDLIPTAYAEALKDCDLEIVSRPEINVTQIESGKPFIFTAEVAVKPEVTLGEYKGVEVEKSDVEVTDEDINKEVDKERENNSRTIDVDDRAVESGDIIKLDFDGSVDGVPFAGGKAENYTLTIGSGSFIPGFEDQLIGCKAGDEKDVVVTFPEEYHAKELAGKEATFKCKVHKVEETILPEIDDEFAKDVSDTCETLDDLKKEITERLKAERQEAADNAFEEKVLDAVIDGMKADIPAAMIDAQVDTIVQDFGYRLQMQGMGLEQYLKMTGTEMGAFRAMFKDQAERQVKTRLALQKVVELEGITVSDKELEEEYAKMAEQYKMEVEKVKAIVSKEALEGDLKISNALEFIKKNAKVKKAAKKKAAEETAE